MESSDWANLPKNLLDSVIERLPAYSDYLRFSVVCMPWNSIAKDNIGKRTAPMLLTYSMRDETWYLCDITRDKILDLQLDLPERRFSGFSKGWLISMDENFILNLINPLSRIKGRIAKEKSIINLPAINISENDLKNWAGDSDFCIFRATISADPISNAKDCIVTVTHENYCQLAFIRIDKDTTWTYIRFEGPPFVIGDIVYVEDKFYYFQRMKGLYSFVVTSDQFTSQDVKLVVKDTADNHYKEYLVELSDHKELWMVRRYMVWKRRRPGQEGILKTKEFKVYKLDADECKWTEIHTLGGFALFVGANSSIVVLASNFSRCFPNCIYFVNDWIGLTLYFDDDVGVYNIEEKRLLSIPRHTLNMMKMSWREPIWIEATLELQVTCS